MVSGGFTRAAWLLSSAVALCASGCACEPVDLTGARFACTEDTDCLQGFACGADGFCADTSATADAGSGDGGATDGGCVASEASEHACHNGVDDDCDGQADCEDPDCEGLVCAAGGALACQSGTCGCGVKEVLIAQGAHAGGTVLPFEGRLAWLYGGEDGGIFYGECEGACDTLQTQMLDAPAYPRQRPMLKRGGNGLIAAWRRTGGGIGFGECAGSCLDGGFETAVLPGFNLGPMPPDVAAAGTARAIIAMDANDRPIWVECDSGCDDPSRWTSRVLSSAGKPRGLAAAMWELEDGGIQRLAAYGNPLVTRTCAGNCAAASAWSSPLTLDSDSFQPELQRNDAGRIALFARSDALKRLFAFICEAGSDCGVPQAWSPVVAWSFPAETRDFNASVTPDGRFAFTTSSLTTLFTGEETATGFTSAEARLCDGGTFVVREPGGFLDARGRWTILHHSDQHGTRLYLPYP